ncbi:MAG: 3'-5' exonuclease [Prochlorococcaceae cyanobacterium]
MADPSSHQAQEGDPQSLWQQSDLLGLLSTPQPVQPVQAAGEPEPAEGPAEQPTAKGAIELPPLAARNGTCAPQACPGTLLIIDTETTALSPDQGQCIEVGAILFAVSQRCVLTQVSFLLPCEHNPAEAINGIAAAATQVVQPWQAALSCFEAMIEQCDAVLAHNASFDRQWFGSGQGPLKAINKPWICSMEDMRWPPQRQLKANPSVRDLALAHGVPVWAAHRALTDCIYLAQVLERCEGLEGLLQAALEPRLLFRAKLSYSERQRAKEAGFRWNDPIQGAWTRRLSEREAQALPFPVQQVQQTGTEATSWAASA